jgi:hypothetical protein
MQGADRGWTKQLQGISSETEKIVSTRSRQDAVNQAQPYSKKQA